MGFGFKVQIWILLKVIGFVSLVFASGLPDHFRVAGLFEPEYESMELAFKSAIEKMNLHHVVGSGRLIVYDVQKTAQRDSFEANREVCRQMKVGIAAVFGPISKIPRGHVQSICNAFEIPHLQAQWDSRDPRDYFSISVYPDYAKLGEAFADLIKEWGWKKYTIIYEDNDSLIRLQEVLKAAKGKDYSITVRKLDTYQSGYITMFKDIKFKDEFHIIIDCDVAKVQPILHEALKVNMLSEYYHFHFTTLDLGMVNLDDYKFGGANITSMRLIDPTRPQVMEVVAEWLLTEHDIQAKSPLLGQNSLRTETALMYDAVHLFARALAELAGARDVTTEALSCNKKQTWMHGNSLLNYMKSMDFEGLSGRIRFEQGKRVDFKLDVIELTQNGLRTIGNWQPQQGVNITASYNERSKENLARLQNRTLSVVTVFEAPYMILRNEPDERGRMEEGFMVDLLDRIADRLGFNYSIYEAPDKTYGAKGPNGEWSGIMGELMHKDSNKRADLAAAGMTITYVREQVVDFTKPFLNLGITILYKKPMKSPPELFSFSQPLSIDVWIYMVAAYLCVSFMLFVIARFSPYEWQNPHPCNEDSDIVENQFTILNSLWFTIGSLMQQGCEIAPRAISTRMVSCIWWFFTLIMISSYTANLAAFLTVERMDSPIENADDLARQTAIKYGTVKGGSTKQFFKFQCNKGRVRLPKIRKRIQVNFFFVNLGFNLRRRTWQTCSYLRSNGSLVNSSEELGEDQVITCQRSHERQRHGIREELSVTDNLQSSFGSDIAPRSLSARLVASVWYLFTLIIVSSYTANLASSLTVERMISPIENVDDLSKQTKIKYGTLNQGSTKQFFQMSDIPTFKKMWSFMDANKDSVFVNSTPDGVARVLNSDYAYLAESPTIDYIVQKNCKKLTQIGGLLDSKGYGIATPKDSPWTEYISNEIIYLQESQVIQKLYTKWWKEKSGGTCVEEKSKDASALGIKHVGGVFVVLIGGLIAGLLLACVEFMWKARKNARTDKQSFCSEVSEELRFAIRCMGKSGKATRRSTSKDIIDNGIQFAPLTGIPNNRTNAKELYA